MFTGLHPLTFINSQDIEVFLKAVKELVLEPEGCQLRSQDGSWAGVPLSGAPTHIAHWAQKNTAAQTPVPGLCVFAMIV